MDTVLGLSMTSAGVAWVLSRGSGADASAIDHDHFSVADSATDGGVCRYQAAVRGARAIAEASGHRITSVGITFTSDVEAEATLLLNALPDMGFENVVAIPLSTAAESWAHAFGRTLGFERCALCVVEPSAVTVVSVLYNFVRTATTQMRESADGIARWLSSVFEVNRSQPETLYLLGTLGDLELIGCTLEDALPIPVVSSDDAQLALARGAALSVGPELAARAQPKPDARETARIPTRSPKVRDRFADRFGPRTRAAAGLVVGLAGLLAVGATLVGESNAPGDLDSASVATEAAAASTPSMSIHAVPSVSIHAVPSAPAAPMTVQRAAAPLPAPPPPQTPPAIEQPVAELPLAVDQPVVTVAEPIAEEPPAAPAPVEALANIPEPQAVPAPAPLPEAIPEPAVAPPPVIPDAMPAAPPPPEVPPPPPVDPLQAALSPLFGGLP
ncbi:DUF7159 family protein [Mycolicibacterium phlei]